MFRKYLDAITQYQNKHNISNHTNHDEYNRFPSTTQIYRLTEPKNIGRCFYLNNDSEFTYFLYLFSYVNHENKNVGFDRCFTFSYYTHGSPDWNIYDADEWGVDDHFNNKKEEWAELEDGSKIIEMYTKDFLENLKLFIRNFKTVLLNRGYVVTDKNFETFIKSNWYNAIDCGHLEHLERIMKDVDNGKGYDAGFAYPKFSENDYMDFQKLQDFYTVWSDIQNHTGYFKDSDGIYIRISNQMSYHNYLFLPYKIATSSGSFVLSAGSNTDCETKTDISEEEFLEEYDKIWADFIKEIEAGLPSIRESYGSFELIEIPN